MLKLLLQLLLLTGISISIATMWPRHEIQNPDKLEEKSLNSSIFQLPNPSAIPIIHPLSKIKLSSSQATVKAYQAPLKTSNGQDIEAATVRDHDEAGKGHTDSSSGGQILRTTAEWPSLTEAMKPGRDGSVSKLSSKQDCPNKHSSSTESSSSTSPSLTTSHQLVRPPTLLPHQSIGYRPTSSEPAVGTWKPDVYARAYVPESLVAVNWSPATFALSKGRGGIDYQSYILSFAGSLFLRPYAPAAPLDWHSFNQVADPPVTLSSESYLKHFQNCLNWEWKAQLTEYRSYDMFRVRVIWHDLNNRIYSVVVPGLREGTPRIVIGDTVLLRQLRLDHTMLPCLMSQWMAPGGGQQRGEPAPGFTGFQHCAAVWGIDKPKDMLLLRIDNLVPESMIFNVSFTAPMDIVQAMQRAVSVIHDLLNEKGGRTSPWAPGEAQRTDATIVPRHPQISTHNANQYRPNALCLEGSAIASSEESSSTVSRSPALENSSQWVSSMLFPSEIDGNIQLELPKGHFGQVWFDPQLNYEQMKAVDAIQTAEYGTLPYLIFGPPGTGKTKTIVETALQLVNRTTCSHILLCAPSDPAADILALRLRQHLTPTDLLRLNAPSRTFAEVPGELLPYCYTANDQFMLPAFKTLMKLKIIVTTCRDADILVQARVTNQDLVKLERTLVETIHSLVPESSSVRPPAILHWGALFVDEAAQATEPELGIAITVVSPPSDTAVESLPRLVMAGDEHQLGPRLASSQAALRLSLFERLLNRPVYREHPMARRKYRKPPTVQSIPMIQPPFADLVRNYRSHPAILAVPSALFYHDTLTPEAADVDGLQNWSAWKGRRWPVLFSCNGGADEIEHDGRGWYNTHEAFLACNYALSIIRSGLITRPQDICIMSPFRAQVHLIRQTIRKEPYLLSGINIGPMEAFQGLESRVVILCTTRVRSRFLDGDRVTGVGIIHEAKRFNVALTRAKEGLIVLGNPYTLARDPCWLTFMTFCHRNGLWDLDPSPKNSMHMHSTTEQQELAADVNTWSPSSQTLPLSAYNVSRLENALIYRERQEVREEGKRKYSSAAERFMDTREDDTMWVSGLLAEEEVMRK